MNKMKGWLREIERKVDLEDKFQYDYVLNQSERTQHLPEELYQEFLSSLKQEDFFFYPYTEKFKEKICEFYGVENNQLFLCAGSDLGIKSVLEAFTDNGRVISSSPSYPMYKVYSKDPKAKINVGIRRRLAPLLDNNRNKIELMNVLLFRNLLTKSSYLETSLFLFASA